MKKRFFVISKEKLYAYVVSVFTIVTLFLMSKVLNSDLVETEQTSSNKIENNIENNIVIVDNTVRNTTENTIIVNNVIN